MQKPSRYFRLKPAMQSGKWSLDEPLDEQGREPEDFREFTSGRPVQVSGRLAIPIDEPGRWLDYSTAGAGMTPVVHVRVATLFAELAPDDVQLIPVDVKGCPDEYLILVATRLVRCIDDEASEEVLYWKPEDERAEKLGQYRSVYGLRIDRSKVGDAKVFRTWGWSGVLIVSEDIKAALERAKVSGAEFEEV
ncbi:imm11 family protein [Corallococcus terminator]